MNVWKRLIDLETTEPIGTNFYTHVPGVVGMFILIFVFQPIWPIGYRLRLRN